MENICIERNYTVDDNKPIPMIIENFLDLSDKEKKLIVDSESYDTTSDMTSDTITTGELTNKEEPSIEDIEITIESADNHYEILNYDEEYDDYEEYDEYDKYNTYTEVFPPLTSNILFNNREDEDIFISKNNKNNILKCDNSVYSIDHMAESDDAENIKKKKVRVAISAIATSFIVAAGFWSTKFIG